MCIILLVLCMFQIMQPSMTVMHLMWTILLAARSFANNITSFSKFSHRLCFNFNVIYELPIPRFSFFPFLTSYYWSWWDIRIVSWLWPLSFRDFRDFRRVFRVFLNYNSLIMCILTLFYYFGKIFMETRWWLCWDGFLAVRCKCLLFRLTCCKFLTLRQLYVNDLLILNLVCCVNICATFGQIYWLILFPL